MTNVRPTLEEHAKAVVAIQNSSVRANLQSTWLTGRERQDQFVRREAAK